MQRPHSTRANMIALLLGTTLSATSPALAAPSRASLVSIEQIGDGNHAAITQIGGTRNYASAVADGAGNGLGTIAGRTVSGMERTGDRHKNQNGKGHEAHGNGNGYGHDHDEDAADLVMPSFASGVIFQEGADNTALVRIKGSRNDFHIAQIGENNLAAQAVLGSDNSAVITQGREFAAASNNLAMQLQVGAGNTAYVAQNGDGNVSKQVQVGPLGALLAAGMAAAPMASPETLLAASNLLAGASGNVSLLEQNGDDNVALLIQAGSNNLIALRQPGDAFASVTQIGSGHQVRIDQSAGANGVTPVMVIQSGFGGSR